MAGTELAEVKGIATTSISSTVPSTAVSVSAVHEQGANFLAQANVTQTLAVLPHAVLNYVFAIMCVILLVALAMNIFIKIRIQYPVLIANGLSLIVVLGVFIVANQDIFGALGKIL